MQNKFLIAVNCPYSNLFNDLLVASREKGIISEAYYYGYSFAQMIYLRNFIHLIPSRNVENDILNDYSFFFAKQSIDILENHSYLSRFISGLKSFIQNKRLNKSNFIFLIYNEYRLESQATIAFCKKHNYNYLCFERGLYRNQTLTIDRLGLNQNSEYYKNYSSPRFLNFEKPEYFEPKKYVKLTFVIFYLIKSIESIFLPTQKLPYKGKRLLDYIKLLVKQLNNNHTSEKKLPKNYWFVPLQLENDTNIKINSPFDYNQEVINYIESNFYQSTSANFSKLVFKKHPLDTNKYTFKKNTITVDAETNELVNNALGVVTVNSTVGFEAILRKKQLFTLGNSIYANINLTHKNPTHNLLDFFNLKFDENTMKDRSRFVLNLIPNYQIPGDIFHYNEKTINYIIKYHLIN